MHSLFLAAIQANAVTQVVDFIRSGGVFMIFIILCSFVGVTVVLHRALSLRWNLVLPNDLIYYIQRIRSNPRGEDLSGLAAAAAASPTPLGKVLAVTFDLRDEDSETMRGAVEACAKEEVIKMQNGLSVLEVIITVAPMLGLLGTVSGLVAVFGVLGAAGAADPSPTQLAAGIAEALTTTIAGIVVAIPAVMAHSYFNKRIERLAARMEVHVAEVIQALQRAYHRAPERAQAFEMPAPAPAQAAAPASPLRQIATLEPMSRRDPAKPYPGTAAWPTPSE